MCYLRRPASKDVVVIDLSLIWTLWVCLGLYNVVLLNRSVLNMCCTCECAICPCGMWMLSTSSFFYVTACVLFFMFWWFLQFKKPGSIFRSTGCFFILFVEGKVWCSSSCVRQELGSLTKGPLWLQKYLPHLPLTCTALLIWSKLYPKTINK